MPVLETLISVTDKASKPLLEFEKRVNDALKPVRNLQKALRSLDRVSGFKYGREAFNDLKESSTAFLFNIRNIGQSFDYVRKAAGKVVDVVDAISSKGDEIAKTSERLGLSVEELQKYRYVADLAGVSSEKFTVGIKKLSEVSVKAANGSEEQARAFKALGVSIRNSDGGLKSSQEILLSLSNRFSDTGKSALTSSEKIFAAQTLFGDSGSDLITVLNQGSDAIKKQMDELEKYGIMTDEETKKSALYRDSLTRLHAVVNGLVNSLSGKLLDPMIDSVGHLTKFLSDNKDVLSESLRPFIESIPEMTKVFEDALPGILSAFSDLTGAAKWFVDHFGVRIPVAISVAAGAGAPLIASLVALARMFKFPLKSLFTLVQLTRIGVPKGFSLAKKSIKGIGPSLKRLFLATKEVSYGFNLMGKSAMNSSYRIRSTGNSAMKTVGKLTSAFFAFEAASSAFEKLTDSEERKKGFGRIFLDVLEDIPVFGSVVKGIENLSVDKVEFDDVSSIADVMNDDDVFDSDLFNMATTKTINKNVNNSIDVTFHNASGVDIKRRGPIFADSTMFGNNMVSAF